MTGTGMHWEKSWLKYYMYGIFTALAIVVAYEAWKRPRNEEQR